MKLFSRCVMKDGSTISQDEIPHIYVDQSQMDRFEIVDENGRVRYSTNKKPVHFRKRAPAALSHGPQKGSRVNMGCELCVVESGPDGAVEYAYVNELDGQTTVLVAPAGDAMYRPIDRASTVALLAKYPTHAHFIEARANGFKEMPAEVPAPNGKKK
jgi:hypothetical protein